MSYWRDTLLLFFSFFFFLFVFTSLAWLHRVGLFPIFMFCCARGSRETQLIYTPWFAGARDSVGEIAFSGVRDLVGLCVCF